MRKGTFMLKTDYLGCRAPEIPLKFWQGEALHLWRLGSATYSMSKWVIYRDWNRDHESRVLSPLYLTSDFLAATNRYIMVRQQVIWWLLKLFFTNAYSKKNNHIWYTNMLVDWMSIPIVCIMWFLSVTIWHTIQLHLSYDWISARTIV